MAINTTASLNQAIPGFSGNTAKASKLIQELLSGNLTTGERGAIYNAGAERATLSGMPGASASGGSLFANADLRNIGVASGQRQQQGFEDLLAMLGQYSGNVVPTAGQEMQNNQFNSNLQFQRGEADRNYGLNRNAADLKLAAFNEQYGPKEYSQSYLYPGGGKQTDYKYYMNSAGKTSPSASALMYKYKY